MDSLRRKAVIFDLDGTLTDTLRDLRASTNHALSLMGWPTRTLDEVRSFVGNGVGQLIRRAAPATASDADVSLCLSRFKEHYALHCQDTTCLYPGIDALIDALHLRRVPMAIVSNKLQSGVDDIARRFFAGRIPVAIGERQGVARKPAPDMVSLAIAALGLHSRDCLYVGDSEVDILTARAASLPCVSVLWGFRSRQALEEAGATHFITHPGELLHYVG